MAKKVIFVPYNLYLHYDSFQRVMAELGKMGVETFLLRLSNLPYYYTLSGSINDHSSSTQCRVQDVSILKLLPGCMGMARRTLNFLFYPINVSRLRRFLRKEKPDMVVVGSDLGHLEIRALLDICRRSGIPVLILTAANSWPIRTVEFPKTNKMKYDFRRNCLRLLGLDALFFDGYLYGSFHEEALITVSARQQREHLLNSGILAERIVATDNPAHDALYEIKNISMEAAKSKVMQELNWDVGKKLICYCTERIQDIYGDEYLERINQSLLDAFEGLPEDCYVVIKLHPKEDSRSIGQYNQWFKGTRYKVLRDTDLPRLLYISNLVLGHFSQTLITSALLGSPTLSLHLIKDDERMVFGVSKDILYVANEIEIHEKISRIILDQEFRAAHSKALHNWITEQSFQVDGQSAYRIADVIKNSIGDCKRA